LISEWQTLNEPTILDCDLPVGQNDGGVINERGFDDRIGIATLNLKPSSYGAVVIASPAPL
jgi:hypothetical protein